MKTANRFESLPGGLLILAGLADYQAGRCTVPACLVAIARTRLTRAGLLPYAMVNPLPEPEQQLYRLLRAAGGDAYSRYNALVRELVSFTQSLDHLDRCPASTLSGESLAGFPTAATIPDESR